MHIEIDRLSRYIYIDDVSNKPFEITYLKKGDVFRYTDSNKKYVCSKDPYINENGIWEVLAEPV